MHEHEVRPTEFEGVLPWVSNRRWRGLKDSLYSLLIHRADQLPRMTFGDPADRRLVGHLAALKPEGTAAAWLLGAVFDMGYDLGRHVYSKKIVRDDLMTLFSQLAIEVSQTGLGTLEALEAGHRSADVRFETKPEMSASSRVLTNFAFGVVLGTIEEVFNSDAHMDVTGPATVHIQVGSGRDVNREAASGG